jgi:hypothetical protein
MNKGQKARDEAVEYVCHVSLHSRPYFICSVQTVSLLSAVSSRSVCWQKLASGASDYLHPLAYCESVIMGVRTCKRSVGWNMERCEC